MVSPGLTWPGLAWLHTQNAPHLTLRHPARCHRDTPEAQKHIRHVVAVAPADGGGPAKSGLMCVCLCARWLPATGAASNLQYHTRVQLAGPCASIPGRRPACVAVCLPHCALACPCWGSSWLPPAALVGTVTWDGLGPSTPPCARPLYA